MTTIKAGNLRREHVGKLITIHLEDGVTITDVLEGYAVGINLRVALKNTCTRDDFSSFFLVDADSTVHVDFDPQALEPKTKHNISYPKCIDPNTGDSLTWGTHQVAEHKIVTTRHSSTTTSSCTCGWIYQTKGNHDTYQVDRHLAHNTKKQNES